MNDLIDVKQIQSNYNESFDFLYNRKQRQVSQLVLLNNLQRGDENIASTMMVTLFNQIMSNMYDDKMQIKFVPGEEVDNKKVNIINLLAQNDYREMNKAEIDYDWIWDTLFFGRGYVETLKFDKKRKIMKPSVINPLAMGYDPYFDQVQDWRYYWKWITKNKYDLKKLIDAGVIDGVKDVRDIPSGVDPYLWDFKVRRDQAKKANAVSTDTNSGDVYQILEMGHYNKDGEKVISWYDKDFSKCLMSDVLDLEDAEKMTDNEKEKPGSKWPIVVKQAYKEPHASVDFSVADLIDDKHRAMSVLLNLAFIAAKDKANPLYGYNPDKVKDVTQFFNRQINQHIPMDDASAAWPLNTQEPMSSGLMQFISILTQQANGPVGTGMAQQPVKKGKQTATESAIQQQMNDLAQSLQSKVMQFGEKEFWSHWYHRYLKNTKEGDEKIATIIGVKGMNFEKIDMGDIRTKFPPGILVYSAKEAEYKELVLRRDLMQLYPTLQETLGPDGMRNFNKYVFFPKFLNDPTLVDIILPKSIDEIKAEEENESLIKNEMPNVDETDDHQQHIYIHQMAKKTWATFTHMAWHEELLAEQKKEQQAKAQEQAQQGQGGGEGDSGGEGGAGGSVAQKKKPKIKEKSKNPMEAAVPLKEAAMPKPNKQ